MVVYRDYGYNESKVKKEKVKSLWRSRSQAKEVTEWYGEEGKDEC